MKISGMRALVTGGHGFLGRHVCDFLKKAGAIPIPVSRRTGCDLRHLQAAVDAVNSEAPDVVIHLAATVGGIGANRREPGRFFYENMLMGLNVVEACRKTSVAKLALIGTVCSFPKLCPTPFKEESLWDGMPEETNSAYGIAKRALLSMGQAYRNQYGMNVIYLIPINLYGRGDNFDIETSHVIPALIEKFRVASREGLKKVTCWGTGKATREFLHVQDAAEGVVSAVDEYNGEKPINLGTGIEITIKELSEKIAHLTKFTGDIIWDHSQPDGQPRRCLDTAKAWTEFRWKSKIPFDEGLADTVKWYLDEKQTEKSGKH